MFIYFREKRRKKRKQHEKLEKTVTICSRTESLIFMYTCVWFQGWGNSVSKTTRVSCTTNTRCAHRWTTTRYASANKATTSSSYPGLPTPGAAFVPKVSLQCDIDTTFFFRKPYFKKLHFGPNFKNAVRVVLIFTKLWQKKKMPTTYLLYGFFNHLL